MLLTPQPSRCSSSFGKRNSYLSCTCTQPAHKQQGVLPTSPCCTDRNIVAALPHLTLLLYDARLTPPSPTRCNSMCYKTPGIKLLSQNSPTYSMSQMHLPSVHTPCPQGRLQDSSGHTTFASGHRSLPDTKPLPGSCFARSMYPPAVSNSNVAYIVSMTDKLQGRL
jgi:hypothetical protein